MRRNKLEMRGKYSGSLRQFKELQNQTLKRRSDSDLPRYFFPFAVFTCVALCLPSFSFTVLSFHCSSYFSNIEFSNLECSGRNIGMRFHSNKSFAIGSWISFQRCPLFQRRYHQSGTLKWKTEEFLFLWSLIQWIFVNTRTIQHSNVEGLLISYRYGKRSCCSRPSRAIIATIDKWVISKIADRKHWIFRPPSDPLAPDYHLIGLRRRQLENHWESNSAPFSDEILTVERPSSMVVNICNFFIIHMPSHGFCLLDQEFPSERS
jgi:hypothetical protein